MVSGAPRCAGRAGNAFPRWKIREAVKLGREFGAKAVEVCGMKFYSTSHILQAVHNCQLEVGLVWKPVC